MGCSALKGLLLRRDAVTCLQPYASAALLDPEPSPPNSLLAWFRLLSTRYLEAEKELIKMHGKQDWRWLLSVALLSTCAADIPADLPSILLWGCTQRRAPGLQQTFLQTTRSFLRSEVEHWIRRRLWRCEDCTSIPPLPQPHALRPLLSYCSQARSCLESFRNLHKGESTMGDAQEFVLSCRWSRIDAFAGDLSFMHVLKTHIAEGLRLPPMCDPKALSAAGQTMYACTMVSLDILETLVSSSLLIYESSTSGDGSQTWNLDREIAGLLASSQSHFFPRILAVAAEMCRQHATSELLAAILAINPTTLNKDALLHWSRALRACLHSFHVKPSAPIVDLCIRTIVDSESIYSNGNKKELKDELTMLCAALVAPSSVGFNSAPCSGDDEMDGFIVQMLNSLSQCLQNDTEVRTLSPSLWILLGAAVSATRCGTSNIVECGAPIAAWLRGHCSALAEIARSIINEISVSDSITVETIVRWGRCRALLRILASLGDDTGTSLRDAWPYSFMIL
jgi:hypothetical protein